jgi:hypothetical protein
MTTSLYDGSFTKCFAYIFLGNIRTPLYFDSLPWPVYNDSMLTVLAQQVKQLGNNRPAEKECRRHSHDR